MPGSIPELIPVSVDRLLTPLVGVLLSGLVRWGSGALFVNIVFFLLLVCMSVMELLKSVELTWAVKCPKVDIGEYTVGLLCNM